MGIFLLLRFAAITNRVLLVHHTAPLRVQEVGRA